MEHHTEAADSDGEDRKPAPQESHGGSRRSLKSEGEEFLKSDEEIGGAPSHALRDETHQPIPMLTARKREYKTLEELDAMADELRVAPMPTEEKSRQMGLIYSRRKRLRKQKRIEELMIQRDEIRSDISRLRNENDRLRAVRQSCLEELSGRLHSRQALESLQREQLRADLLPVPSRIRSVEADALMNARLYPPGSSSILHAESLEGLQRLRMQQALVASLSNVPSQLGPNPTIALSSLRAPIVASSAIGPMMEVGTVRPRGGLEIMTQLAAARELEGARQSHRALFSALNEAQVHYSNLQRSALGGGPAFYPVRPLESSFLSPSSTQLQRNDDLLRFQDRLERLPPAELSAFLDNLRVRTSPMEKILEEFERKRAAK